MIDWNQVRNLCDEIGAEDFGDVVALFLADTDAAIDGLVADDRLAVQLHYLKGSAVTMGFSDLAELCRRGEKTARGGGYVDIAKIAQTFRNARHEFVEKLPDHMPVGVTAPLT